jgi:hypothetical protein
MSSNELQRIRMVFQGLQTLYQTHLPKVDAALINYLLICESDKTKVNSSLPPFYLVKIETIKGTDQERMKNILFKKTGLLPSIYENGTQYVANMRLSLERLKEICESQKEIVKITAD